MKKLLLLLSLMLCFPQVGYSQEPTVKELYQLKEMCGNQTAKEFKKEYGNGYLNTQDSYTVHTYINHYNKRLNICLYQLHSDSFKNTPRKKIVSTTTLIDLTENISIAILMDFTNSPLICEVNGKSCSTEQEWYDLVKPFMNE